MDDAIRREVERALRHLIVGGGRIPPPLTDVRLDENSTDLTCDLRFQFGNNGAWFHIRLPYELRRWNQRRNRDHAFENFANDCRSIYSRVCEDHIISFDLQQARERLHELAMTNPDDGALARAQEEYLRAFHEINRHHSLGYCTTGPMELPPMTAIEVRMLENEFAVGYLDRYEVAFSDVGGNKANAKALALLKANLTPEQLEQYEKHRYFEVTGSHSGQTYRIRYGRQMNVDVFDKPLGWFGRKKRAAPRRTGGLCFMPEGQLAAGDVMLAQKIMLENDEPKALAVANKTG